MWGQEREVKIMKARMGIIPTRVGTRHFGYISESPNEDHPHACGDKIDDATYLMVNEGSSPRVWGQEAFVLGATLLP